MNENVNKVIYGNQTVMDITDTTAEESDVASGEVFYKANGARSVGTLNKDSAVWGNISGTLSDQTDLQTELNRAYSKTASETSSLDDLDLIPVQKISASSDGRRNIKFKNLKSILKTYFDAIYSTFSGSYNDLTNKPTAGTGIAINNNVIAVDADNTPTKNSEKPVKSKGVYSAVESSREESTTLLKSTVGWTGKNLLKNQGFSRTSSGLTYVYNIDGSVTVNGTATANSYIQIKTLADTNPVPIEGIPVILSGAPAGSAADKYWLYAKYRNADDTAYEKIYEDYGNGIEFTIPSGRKWEVYMAILNGQTVNNLTFYPMIRRANITDDTYEPYHETVEQCKFDRSEQRVLGAKNRLKYDLASLKSLNSGTWNNNVFSKNGVDFTVNDDLSISISGTSSTRTDFLIYMETGSFSGMILNGNPLSTSDVELRIGFHNSPWTVLAIQGSGDDVTIKDYSVQASTFIRILANKTVNTIVKPMIRLASDPDDTYVPYAMTNRELTEEKLSISELKTIASSAADFAAFKTAIANL